MPGRFVIAPDRTIVYAEINPDYAPTGTGSNASGLYAFQWDAYDQSSYK